MESEDNLKKVIAEIKDDKQTPGLIRQLDAALGEKVAAN